MVQVSQTKMTCSAVLFQISLPDTYRGDHRNEDTAGRLYSAEVNKVMESLKAQGTGVAAFIHETMPCCAGQIVPPKDYYTRVYKWEKLIL